MRVWAASQHTQREREIARRRQPHHHRHRSVSVRVAALHSRRDGESAVPRVNPANMAGGVSRSARAAAAARATALCSRNPRESIQLPKHALRATLDTAVPPTNLHPLPSIPTPRCSFTRCDVLLAFNFQVFLPTHTHTGCVSLYI